MTSAVRLVDAIDHALGGDSNIKRIGVAVSGGSDSLALLHLLHEWGKKPIFAATVDHKLRVEAADEAAQVAKIAEALGIPHQTLEWKGWDGKGNLQDQARQNRYGLLAAWAEKVSLDSVCLGHTQDDQIETFLMRLDRAAGLEGLSGMNASFVMNDTRFYRPLLQVRRKALQEYLVERNVQWIDDPSNEDERYLRVKARQAVATLEEHGFDIEGFDHSITNLSLANLELRDREREVAAKLSSEIDGDLVIDRASFRQLNPEMRRRLLSKALLYVSGEYYAPRWEALSDLETAILQTKNHTLHGCLILNSDMTVRITREHNAVKDLATPTTTPWDGRWHLKGPHANNLEVRALGEAVKDTPWRETGMPRQSLLASPAVWHGHTLIAAPVAGLSNGWTAEATGRGNFADFLLSR